MTGERTPYGKDPVSDDPSSLILNRSPLDLFPLTARPRFDPHKHTKYWGKGPDRIYLESTRTGYPGPGGRKTVTLLVRWEWVLWEDNGMKQNEYYSMVKKDSDIENIFSVKDHR